MPLQHGLRGTFGNFQTKGRPDLSERPIAHQIYRPEGGNSHHGTATHAPTTATSGINAKINGAMLFMWNSLRDLRT